MAPDPNSESSPATSMNTDRARAEEIYTAALDADVLLYLKGDELAYKAKGSLSSELFQLLRQNKAPLIDYLRDLECRVDSEGPRPLADRSRLPVSRAQRRIWLAEQATNEGAHFNIQGCFRFKGHLKRTCFVQALRHLVRCHEPLRANFHERGGELHQELRSGDEAVFTEVDLSMLGTRAQEGAVRELIAEDLRTRFDLARDPLFRVTLVRLAADLHVAVFNLHHIIADGWSVGLLVEQFSRAYEAYDRTGRLEEAPARLQYADYAAWQEARLDAQALAHGLAFWDARLADLPPVHGLPLDRPRPARLGVRGEQVRTTIDVALERRIRAYCEQRKVSLFMFLETALAVLLAHYGSHTDIVIGTPVAGRTHPESESLIGLFINTIALRTRIEPGVGFDALLQANREDILSAFDHQHVPFEMLVDRYAPRGNRGHHPIFQVWFVLQNNRKATFAVPGCEIEAYDDLPPPAAKYELNLYAHEEADGIRLDWVFNTELFERESIACVAGQFVQLLCEVLDAPERDCLTYAIFAPDMPAMAPLPTEVAALCAEEEGLVRRLSERMGQRASAPALACDGQSYTYAQLQERALGYVGAFRRHGGTSRIGLLLERGVDIVAAMLAALQVGRTYVPLDPGYPPARLEHMRAHAGCDLIVARAKHAALAAAIGGGIPVVEGPDEDGIADPAAAVRPGPAYILYTSGSTGHPKGVVQSHVGLAYQAGSYACELGLEEDDRVLQLASFNFDASVLDTFGTLLAGASLHLVDPKTTAPGRLLQLVGDAGITVYHSTPTVFKYLFGNGTAGDMSRVRAVVLGGEPVDAHSIEIFRRVFGQHCRLFGLYGATEASFTALSEPCRPDIESGACRGLGRAIGGTQLLVRRPDGSEARTFEAGEIVIRSRYTARGYWNEADLTARRFRAAGEFVDYASGDQGYRGADGAVRFLGRRDFQYKLHGVRIELGEIEATLRQLDSVIQAAAVVQPLDASQGAAELVAYVQWRSPEGAQAPERHAAADCREHLAKWLPGYMVPSRFVFMDALPLTPSGKIDRLALPSSIGASLGQGTYVAPRRPSERTLCAIWREVLQVEKVGVNDNFFDAGGSSMLALQVCRKIEERLSREVSVVDLFTYPTIRALARFLDPEEDGRASPVEDAPAASTGSNIAIIGIACRFPEANDIDAFWRNIADGHESIRFYSEEELLQAGVDPTLIRKPNFVAARALLEGCEDFDADYFALTEREAEITDPQHRVLLECAHEALESGGYGDGGTGRSVGVFVGVGSNKYFLTHLLPRMAEFEALGEDVVHANNKEHHAATRISYKLNLHGPSMSLNTACSTSLVAVHEACKSLQYGECKMALAGGANIVEFEPGGYLFNEGDMRSPDGHCRAFDHQARGTRRGNGVALVLLKPLHAAVADGDTIHAVIKGSSVSNDGAEKVGYVAPGAFGQANAIREAQRRAGVAPASIQYIEANGSATTLGDSIELRALGLAFEGVASGSCAIGSVKPNIGHLEAAAGVAGLVKAVLALKHRQLPPHILYEASHPQVDLERSPFYVNTRLRAWEGKEPRRAGVSAFGLGGTNVHVVLEEAPPGTETRARRTVQVLPLSAKTTSALQTMAAHLADYLERERPRLVDAAFTLQVGRTGHACRRVVVCESLEDAVAQLQRNVPAVHAGEVASTAFVFADYDPQARLASAHEEAHEPEFRRLFERTLALAPAHDEGRVHEHCRWFALNYSLVQLLGYSGVRPDVLAGRGIGEILAACLAGAFSAEHALGLVAARARLLDAAKPERSAQWLEALRSVAMREAEIPFVHGGTGTRVDAGEAMTAADWLARLDSPGDMQGTLDAWRASASAQVCLTFGGDAAVRHLLQERVPAAWPSVVEVLPGFGGRSEDGSVALAQVLGELWLAGFAIDWERYHVGEAGHRVPLPTYPFERRRYWIGRLGSAVHRTHATTPVDTRTGAVEVAAHPPADTEDGIQSWLLDIWTELLGGEPIGPHDDFFELGGNSLLATRLLSRVRERFPVLNETYSIGMFFDAPTVAATAGKIRQSLIDAMATKRTALRQEGVTMEGAF